MRLETLYIRFFRSFNYDYLRKNRDDAVPDPWDLFGPDDLFFPFVRVPLEEDITTVVGANEAGKSQLLSAVECLLGVQTPVKRDFCRYSTEFAEENAPQIPEIGGEFTDLGPDDLTALQGLRAWTASPIESFRLFRFHDRTRIYVGDEFVDVDATFGGLKLPRSFRIDANVPLPESVEIAYLAGKTSGLSRTRRSWFDRTKFLRENPLVLDAPNGQTRPAYSGADEATTENLSGQWSLARRLLIEVAGISQEEFAELAEAVRSSEGYAEALVDKMNRKLADSLNFRKWWTQDSDFALRLRLRDFDLVFTIRDRTGSDYTFGERSQGLKYFLSYFVQYLSHGGDRSEDLLLMDEPDAFLSNSGQQDLLRIFNAFAHPEDEFLDSQAGRHPVQVIYVTHSPFLIDKNHAERIRVLEKGDGEEGTRVVNNAGRNHYEPLRSSLGSFVAETTFISACNLLVEGQADPILLAGASAIGRRIHPDDYALDLNTLTLVPCGGAGNVAYMAYLARGRDEDKPAVVVLVDNDDEGRKALDEIHAIKRLVPDSLLITVAATAAGDERTQVVELEDLVPSWTANQAVKGIALTVLPAKESQAFVAAWKDVQATAGKKLFKALSDGAAEASKTAGLARSLEISKVPFARSVIDVLLDPETPDAEREEFYINAKPLIEVIVAKQREALRQHAHDKISTIVRRLRRGFIADHPGNIRKSEVQALLESIAAQLPHDSDEADTVLDGIRKIHRDFELSDEPRTNVKDPDDLRQRLLNLAYGATNAVQRGDAFAA